MSNLTILKVKDLLDDDKRFDHLNTTLLKPPFMMVINGSVRSGKSNLLVNLIYNNNFYHNCFDNIVYISPTIHLDRTLQHLEDDDVLKVDDPEQLDTVLKSVVESQQSNKTEHTLVIIDDCLGFIKRKSYLTYLSTRYRHHKISLIITSQDFRSIPNIIRTNASAYIIFKTNNAKEYDKLQYEFGGLFQDFKKYYEEATDKPYNFLFVNLRTLALYHDFGKLLYQKN
jgi:hypothetical protein